MGAMDYSFFSNHQITIKSEGFDALFTIIIPEGSLYKQTKKERVGIYTQVGRMRVTGVEGRKEKGWRKKTEAGRTGQNISRTETSTANRKVGKKSDLYVATTPRSKNVPPCPWGFSWVLQLPSTCIWRID